MCFFTLSREVNSQVRRIFELLFKYLACVVVIAVVAIVVVIIVFQWENFHSW